MLLGDIMGRKMGDKKKEEIISDAYEKIEECLETFDTKPYSSNIIGLRLASVARHCGRASANKLIDEFGLEQKGYKKVLAENGGGK
jgi:hypothetical protein